MTYRGHSVLNTLIRCRFSPPDSTNQRFIYTGCAAGRVVIYDLLTGQIANVLDGHEGVVRDVSWHPFNSEIVSTSVSIPSTLDLIFELLCDSTSELMNYVYGIRL